MAEIKLSDKQKRFCDEYIISLNASEAYRKAGYSCKSADIIKSAASRMLANVNLHQYIAEKQQRLQIKTEITQEWVINRLKEISDRCMQEVPVLKRVEGEMVETGEYKFDSTGANKATELLGKHLGLFSDKIELSGKVTNVNLNSIELSEEELLKLAKKYGVEIDD